MWSPLLGCLGKEAQHKHSNAAVDTHMDKHTAIYVVTLGHSPSLMGNSYDAFNRGSPQGGAVGGGTEGVGESKCSV